MGFLRILTGWAGIGQGAGPSTWEAPDSFTIGPETQFSDVSQPAYDGGSNVHQKYPPIWETPYAWEPPDPRLQFIPIEQPANQPTRQPFNPYDVGIASYLSNLWKSAFEITKQQEWNPKEIRTIEPDIKPANIRGGGIFKYFNFAKQLPPSFTYEGPIGGAGPLGLFAPAPGSEKYESYIAKKQPDAIKLAEEEQLATSKVAEIAIKSPTEADPNIIERITEWSGNVGQSFTDFQKGVLEGYTEEKGHTFLDLIPGFSKTTNWPLTFMVGSALLLLLLIIRK